jgi:hypothetical protein
MTTKNIKISNRVAISIDTGDFDTPVMVTAKVGGREHTSTYWCACDTGCVGNDDDYQLTTLEGEALDGYYDEACAAFDAARSA